MKRMLMILCAVLTLSLVGCGGSTDTAAESVDLNALYAGFEETLPAMFTLDEDSMMNFVGVDAADCKQAVIAICADGLRADEVWLIEAKDAAALERLKELAETRIAAKEDETINYIPEQYAVVEQAEIVNEGLYLAVLVSPDVDTLTESVRGAFAE